MAKFIIDISQYVIIVCGIFIMLCLLTEYAHRRN